MRDSYGMNAAKLQLFQKYPNGVPASEFAAVERAFWGEGMGEEIRPRKFSDSAAAQQHWQEKLFGGTRIVLMETIYANLRESEMDGFQEFRIMEDGVAVFYTTFDADKGILYEWADICTLVVV